MFETNDAKKTIQKLSQPPIQLFLYLIKFIEKKSFKIELLLNQSLTKNIKPTLTEQVNKEVLELRC